MTLDQFIQEYWWVLLLVLLWTLPWKAYAAWKAARIGSIGWFIPLLILNTFAILEIFYIFFILPQQEQKLVEENRTEE